MRLVSLTITIFVLNALLVYRVTRFVIEDTLIDGIRNKVLGWIVGSQVEMGPDGMPKLRIPSLWRRKLRELLTCPYCLSAYVAAAATIVTDHYYNVPLPWFYWLAVAAASLMVWRYVEQN